jgi:hypothetical protein
MSRDRTTASHRSASSAIRICALAAAALLAASGPALAQVPDDFLGKWSTDPVRCEQENGEVDVLDVTEDSLAFYEIGCELGQSTPKPDGISFSAQCYKGGSPMSSGTVVLHRTEPDKVDVKLQGFSWITEDPESFRRCSAD